MIPVTGCSVLIMITFCTKTAAPVDIRSVPRRAVVLIVEGVGIAVTELRKYAATQASASDFPSWVMFRAPPAEKLRAMLS